MPRDISGNYTLPFGNPVLGNTVITVEWANPTMSDIAAQFNNVYTRDGLLGPLAPFKMVDGTVALPGYSFNSEPGLGLFKEAQNVLAIASNNQVSARFSDDGMEVPGTISRAGIPIAEVPTGTILDFAGGTAPAGYLLCNGQLVSRTTYAALFAVIGTTWGVGDTFTTFQLPDLRRRTTIGAGGTPVFGPGIALGNVGGAESVALGTTHLPSHNHTVTDATHYHTTSVGGSTSNVSADHAHNFTTGTAGGHQHRYQAALGSPVWQTHSEAYGLFGGGTLDDTGYIYKTEEDGTHYHTGTTGGISANHYHTWSGTHTSDWKSSGISLSATGSNAAFGIMPPSAVVNKIIKT